jgi:cobalt/nickel transport system ATP-binding protein
VGYVFQDADDQLFMPSVEEDVAFGPRNQGLPDSAVQERVQAALQQVGAWHLASRAPWRLSGGEKRAVAIAGVLAMQPGALALDEPSAGLDATARRQLIEVLAAQRCTRVVATHDLALAAELCPRAVLLHAGRVLADGAPQDLYADAALMRECRLEAPVTGSRS